MLISSVKSWREMKRSPYFFMRHQAEKRLKSYSSISLVLLLLTAGVSAYAWQPPQPDFFRSAVLANTKPPKDDVLALLEKGAAQEVNSQTAVAQPISLAQVLLLEDQTAAAFRPTLPPEYDQFEPTAPLNPDTSLGSISFSREITEKYEPRNPAKVFPEGKYTLYATFSYAAMANGMEWAWVWRVNGRAVDGGNELWRYGSDGPGYIYYSPEAGFQAGEYTLEVWVNGELMVSSTAIMNNAAFAAGN